MLRPKGQRHWELVHTSLEADNHVRRRGSGGELRRHVSAAAWSAPRDAGTVSVQGGCNMYGREVSKRQAAADEPPSLSHLGPCVSQWQTLAALGTPTSETVPIGRRSIN